VGKKPEEDEVLTFSKLESFRVGEISATRRLLKAARAGVEMVVGLVKPVLVQYMTKVKEGIVANAASATVTALGVLLGYAFKALLGL
jgi:hypothetical protein